MKLQLTADQIATIGAHMRPGRVLIARITRETFDGNNATTSGTLQIEFGAVPVECLPRLREAIRAAYVPPKAPRGSKRKGGA